MVKKIRINESGKYTLKEKDEFDVLTKEVLPARFSPEDKYGKYRRMAKKQATVADSTPISDKENSAL